MLNSMNPNFLFSLSETVLRRKIREKIPEIHKLQTISPEACNEFKKKKLHHILVNAQVDVPFYKDHFDKNKFNPNDILKDIRYLSDLPCISKEDIRNNSDRFIKTSLGSAKKEKIFKRSTGGSTGATLEVIYDKNALDWTSAANIYAMEMAGKSIHQRECALLPHYRNINSLKDKTIDVFKSLAVNRSTMVINTISEHSLLRLWAKLKRKKPFLIQGHPTIFYQLAKTLQNKGENCRNLFEVFESTGEMIDKNKVNVIERVFGCKVFNRYGNAEFGVIAHSTNTPHQLEILNSIAHLESSSLGNGLEELIATTLTNTAMPLIRYKTGDIGEVKKIEGKEHIVNLHGRVHDIVTLHGKSYPTAYLQDVLDKVGGVDEFQIVKKKNNSIVLNIVLSNDKVKLDVTKKLHSLFKKEINIQFIEFSELRRIGWRDKFLHVITE